MSTSPAAPTGPPAHAFRRVGVVAKATSQEALRTAGELDEWLTRRGIDVLLDHHVLEHLAESGRRVALRPEDEPDLVVVLGGDGTLLSVARSLSRPIPILGVNMGSLGFLTEVHRSELYPALLRVLGGHFDLEARTLLRVELHAAEGGEVRAFSVLNDAVIAKSALARIIDLTLLVDGNVLAHFRADGLIVSTPTGSTAYNLSAGGPILNPQLPVAVITPICPHTLSLRPLVVPDASLIEVTLQSEHEEVFLTLDGQEGAALSDRDRVLIRRAEAGVRLVKTTGRSFYESLREKLRWGG
jgi:NAD+ kinase